VRARRLGAGRRARVRRGRRVSGADASCASCRAPGAALVAPGAAFVAPGAALVAPGAGRSAWHASIRAELRRLVRRAHQFPLFRAGERPCALPCACDAHRWRMTPEIMRRMHGTGSAGDGAAGARGAGRVALARPAAHPWQLRHRRLAGRAIRGASTSTCHKCLAGRLAGGSHAMDDSLGGRRAWTGRVAPTTSRARSGRPARAGDRSPNPVAQASRRCC